MDIKVKDDIKKETKTKTKNALTAVADQNEPQKIF